ncbi:c-type cytochrome [Pontibacter korlensis]|uniref:Cytochrome c domain-containing protein n=1 Tax=Pontibacter korlensis TaxID=400092 RepID=A0A0E3ZIL6_9BACT|nr:c-type cytochrome [Pontibacter korlensis]AKD05128.1 hypothetical protein PKOR_21185 [Pontibacter korlensis]
MNVKYLFSALSLGFILISCGETKSEYDRYYEQSYRDSVAKAMENAPQQVSPAARATAPLEKAETPPQQEGALLIAKSDCTACHRNDQKLVGPAYIDVAKKYEPTEENINHLVTKIIEGGAGVWGEVPMTPHQNVSKEDARKMVDYILALND